MKQWSEDVKNQARQMRLDGASFGKITRKLLIAKSTLHYWVKDIERPPHLYYTNRKEWLEKIRPLASAAIKKKRQDYIDQIIKEINKEVLGIKLDKKAKKAILSILYLAEGSKVRGIMQFANIDPRLNLLFISLMRECYEIDETKFRIRLHLHYYHKIKKTKKFWSKLLGVPLKQFIKVYRKSRSKEKTFRRNFGGICFIKYNSVYLKERLVQHGYSLIEQLVGKIIVPVA